MGESFNPLTLTELDKESNSPTHPPTFVPAAAEEGLYPTLPNSDSMLLLIAGLRESGQAKARRGGPTWVGGWVGEKKAV